MVQKEIEYAWSVHIQTKSKAKRQNNIRTHLLKAVTAPKPCLCVHNCQKFSKYDETQVAVLTSAARHGPAGGARAAELVMLHASLVSLKQERHVGL
jgi:hypothetical protein